MPLKYFFVAPKSLMTDDGCVLCAFRHRKKSSFSKNFTEGQFSHSEEKCVAVINLKKCRQKFYLCLTICVSVNETLFEFAISNDNRFCCIYVHSSCQSTICACTVDFLRCSPGALLSFQTVGLGVITVM